MQHIMNVFSRLLNKLSDKELEVLLLIHSSTNLTVQQLEAAADSKGKDLSVPESLGHLINEDLVQVKVFGNDAGALNLSWLGYGVVNWSRQISEPASRPAEPRQGENGEVPPVGRMGACDEYRPISFRPGYCWCLVHRSEHHTSNGLEAAEP